MSYYDNHGSMPNGVAAGGVVSQWNGMAMGGGGGGAGVNGVNHHAPSPYYLQQQQQHAMQYNQLPQQLQAGDVAVADWGQQPLANANAERALFSQPNSGINFDNYENIPVEVSGQDVPPAIDQFQIADLHDWIKANIERAGYQKPTPVQKNSIPTLLSGRDLMSCAQTGSGKTAAFLLPIVNAILSDGPESVKQHTFSPQGRKVDYPAALILSPTRELAMQIRKEADKFSYRTNIKTAILYGGRENYRDQINYLKAGCHILVATPGRLIDVVQQGHISLTGIKYLVLDEADRMLDMGFEPQIRKVVGLGIPDKNSRTTAMFSATFPKEIQVLAQDFLKPNYVFLAVGRVGSTSENIEQRVLWVEEHEKRRALCTILETTDAAALVLVFVETKRGANELAYFLQRSQVRAVSIHGDLKQFERERNLECFRTCKLNVLVATAVAARGLDIPNVRHVINFDLPNDVDEYVHRIGRTGRCGNTGLATSFFNDKNRPIARDLLSLLTEANQEVPDFVRRCAAEGGVGRATRGRFGGVDHRRGGGRGGAMGGRGGMQTQTANAFGAPRHSYNQQSGASSGGFGGAPRGGYSGVSNAHTGFAGFGNSAPPSFGSYQQHHGQQSYRGFHQASNAFQQQPQGVQGGYGVSSNGSGGGYQQTHSSAPYYSHPAQQHHSQQQQQYNPNMQQRSFGTWNQ